MKKKKQNKIKKDLPNQMKMFEEGGLKEEGGMVDDVSGNDVPIGSTREEVRDDIPAQLSEGEFVFPADVVRFIGLEKLMMLRQEAKAGLKRMEEMGQMGNSEEATLPDDMPFDRDDLDLEEEQEEEGEVTDSNFNRGGIVSMAEGGTIPTTENTDLKFNEGGTTEKAKVGDFYRFKMPGAGTQNNFTKPFTQEGKQYYGFRPLPNGQIAAYRQLYKNFDDADSGSLSTTMDVLDGDTKFSITNPQTEIDPPRRAPMTVAEMASVKDGTVVSRYQPLPNQVYYKSLREYTSQKTPPKQVTETPKPKQVTETPKPKQVTETSQVFDNTNQIKPKSINLQLDNLSTFTPPVNQSNKINQTEPNKNAFLEFKTPQRTMVQQKPLNVRQQDVPMRGMVTNIPKAEDFLKRKPTDATKTPSFASVAPTKIGSRFTDILDISKQGVEQKKQSIADVQKEINSVINFNPYDNNDSDDNDSASGGVQSGGIDYSTVDRFALDDDVRDVFNDFSKAQLSMFSVAASNPFTVIASGIGTALADKTKGFTAFGPINTAELGKIQATAFHQTALGIQNKYGLQTVPNINNWGKEALSELGKQGKVAMDFAKDIYSASKGLPYSSFSFNAEDKKGFLDTAKNVVNSVLSIGKTTPTTSMPSPEIAAKQKGMANLMNTVKDLASKSKVTKENQSMLETIKDAIQLDDEAAFGGYDVNSPSNVNLDELGFNNNAKSDVATNGGSKGIGYTSNGTSYSINNNGTYTHFNGMTVNFTDSKGNPGNPPPPPKQDDNTPSAPSSIDTGKGIETIDYNDWGNNDNNDSNDNSSGAGAESGVGGWT